jgi:hypothetical protein
MSIKDVSQTKAKPTYVGAGRNTRSYTINAKNAIDKQVTF